MPSVTSSSGLKGLVVAAVGGVMLYSAVGNVGISTEIRDLIAGKNPSKDKETGANALFAGIASGLSAPTTTLPPATSGGSTDPSAGEAPIIAGGGRLTAKQIFALTKQAGFPLLTGVTATAVALAESGGNPNAFNNNPATGDLSYGLWQINMIGNLGPARRQTFGIANNEALFDPTTNARAAYILSNHGGSFGAWSTFKNGAYRQFLQQAFNVRNT